MEQKNVQWEDAEDDKERKLVIDCPCEDGSDSIEMMITIYERYVDKELDQLVRFLYNNYPEVCWEYIEEMREFLYGDAFFGETIVKFLIEIIPDIFPDCHFSIDLSKMPETLEEDSESNISKAIEIDVEVVTIESIVEVADIKPIINWLEEKTGFDVILTKCFIQSNFKVNGIM